MTSVVFNECTCSIGESSFEGCSSLLSVELGTKITGIQKNAFKGCSKITEITIPSSVTTFENNVFESCSLLKTVSFIENICVESKRIRFIK